VSDGLHRSHVTRGLSGTTLVVTGGGGFLGHSVLEGLLATFPGRVISINRTPLAERGLSLPDPHVEVLADLRDHERWTGYLREADYVFWMAALRDHGVSASAAVSQNVAPIRAALAVLRDQQRFRRFVFTSSISALDQPNRPHHPRPISDDSPACPRTPYGHSKLMTEQLLAESGVTHTVFRLPFLYGPGFRPGSFLDFYKTVARRRALSAIRFTANLSLLYTGDVAALLQEVLADDNGKAADASPYVLSDGAVYKVDDLITRVAELHGLSRPRFRVPAPLGHLPSELSLAARRIRQPRPTPRGEARLLLSYWIHAAFTRDYFVVDSSRFHAAFPGCTYAPLDAALADSFPERAAV
jgi:nucleoside-diphosphate-sugar epimerase